MKTSLCSLPLLLLAFACSSNDASSSPAAPPRDRDGAPDDTPVVSGDGVRVENGVAHLASALTRREPALPAAELAQRVAGNSRFAFELYHELGAREAGKSFFVSPHSISTALAMAYVGARTRTKDAIARTFHFDQPDDTLHASFNLLDRTLASRERPASGETPALILRTNNDVWASQNEGERPLPEYVDALALDYRSKVNLVNFFQAAETRDTINAEVSRQTSGTIPKLLPEGVIMPGVTTMVLTNSVYFKAAWALPFEKGLTRPGAFANLDGSSGDVPLMEASEQFAYAETADVQAIRLPYTGGETALTIVLPKRDFSEVDASFDLARLDALRAALAPRVVHLRLPAFSLRTPLRLKGPLQDLGMDAGFDTSSSYDFSGIGPSIEFITEVVHEAFIAVDEAGTEAGAATAVLFGTESAKPGPDVEFIADRPFLLVLEDVPTGAVLFAGRYVRAE